MGARDAPVRSLRRRLSPQAIQELVARYNTGEDTPALSQEYGISKTGLGEVLLAEGVAFRRQAITTEDTERAVQLYESGLTIKQVVAQVGYSYGTIRRVLHEHGVAMRATGTGKSATPDQRS
jgi:AraC-like DNA-binding protein